MFYGRSGQVLRGRPGGADLGGISGERVQNELSGGNKTRKEVSIRKDGKLEMGKENFTFTPQEARYVRTNDRARTGRAGFSIVEFEIYEK